VKNQDSTDYQKQDWNYQEKLIPAVCGNECTSVKRQQHFDDGPNSEHKAEPKTDEQKSSLSFCHGPFPYLTFRYFLKPRVTRKRVLIFSTTPNKRQMFPSKCLVSRITGEVNPPEATEEERRRAFTYDFSCVTRFRGCRQPCEIAPLVWQDVYQQSLNSGWTTLVEEASDPHCKFAQNPR